MDSVPSRPLSSIPCGVCKEIFVSPEHLGGKQRGLYTLGRAIGEWKASAYLGCPLCWFLMYSPSCHSRFEWSLERSIHLTPNANFLRFQLMIDSEYFIVLGPLEASRETQKAFFFSVMAEQEKPADANEMLKAAQGWLDTCAGSLHQQCAKPSPDFMPRRLLDVSKDKARLVEWRPTDEPEIYTTLSYCWGAPEEQVLTTSERLRSFERPGIRICDLPKTIQDAVRVNRRLGLRYLWVDALCIVQNDDAEKATELARMAEIYRNSHLTISAASAESVGDGFLDTPEHWSSDGLAPIWLPRKGPDDTARPASRRIGLYHNLMTPLRVQEPISKRAWTLQETLLSRRLLVCGKQVPYFTCVSEQTPKTLYGNRSSISVFQRPLATDSSKSLSRPIKWGQLVAEYSARNLSVPQDKLSALAGVAGRYGPGEDYLAGLWRKDLPEGLMWEPAEGHCAATRADEWRAPSWSWMSVNSRINLTNENLTFKKTVHQLAILQASADPVHQIARLGPIRAATLVVEGAVIPAVYLPSSRRLKFRREKMDGEIGVATLDCPGEESTSSILVDCLLVSVAEEITGVTGQQRDKIATGLVLQPIGTQHRRLGTFRSFPSTFHNFYSAMISEYEFPKDCDIFNRVATHDTDGYIVHRGIYCKGIGCRHASSTQEEITGLRYYCIGCDSSYCGKCKADVRNHPDSDFCPAKENLHRYGRFQHPINESLLAEPDHNGGWRSAAFEVEPIESSIKPRVISLV